MIMSVDEIYGILKTHELDIELRSKIHGGKFKSITLKVKEKAPKEVVVKRSHSKRKALITKFDNESSNSDDGSNSDNFEDYKEDLCSFFGFSFDCVLQQKRVNLTANFRSYLIKFDRA